jgi:GTP cyclohydrolase I
LEAIAANPQDEQLEVKMNSIDAAKIPCAENAVRDLLSSIGEDPNREGLLDTPKRYAKALREMTVGYQMDPSKILERVFSEDCDQVIVLKGIQFTSMCEHHLLPFVGIADVAYLPGGSRGVVGLSKLARLVECFARRLQIQERMTKQIAEALVENLDPRGVAVIVKAKHSCMSCRGVLQHDSEMITSSMLGMFRDNAEARAELLLLLK